MLWERQSEIKNTRIRRFIDWIRYKRVKSEPPGWICKEYDSKDNEIKFPRIKRVRKRFINWSNCQSCSQIDDSFELSVDENVPQTKSKYRVPQTESKDILPQSKDIVPLIQSKDIVPETQSEDTFPQPQSKDIIPQTQYKDIVPETQSKDIVPETQSKDIKNMYLPNVHFNDLLQPCESELQPFTHRDRITAYRSPTLHQKFKPIKEVSERSSENNLNEKTINSDITEKTDPDSFNNSDLFDEILDKEYNEDKNRESIKSNKSNKSSQGSESFTEKAEEKWGDQKYDKNSNLNLISDSSDNSENISDNIEISPIKEQGEHQISPSSLNSGCNVQELLKGLQKTIKNKNRQSVEDIKKESIELNQEFGALQPITDLCEKQDEEIDQKFENLHSAKVDKSVKDSEFKDNIEIDSIKEEGEQEIASSGFVQNLENYVNDLKEESEQRIFRAEFVQNFEDYVNESIEDSGFEKDEKQDEENDQNLEDSKLAIVNDSAIGNDAVECSTVCNDTVEHKPSSSRVEVGDSTVIFDSTTGNVTVEQKTSSFMSNLENRDDFIETYIKNILNNAVNETETRMVNFEKEVKEGLVEKKLENEEEPMIKEPVEDIMDDKGQNLENLSLNKRLSRCSRSKRIDLKSVMPVRAVKELLKEMVENIAEEKDQNFENLDSGIVNESLNVSDFKDEKPDEEKNQTVETSDFVEEFLKS